jgi:hypothetical protein
MLSKIVKTFWAAMLALSLLAVPAISFADNPRGKGGGHASHARSGGGGHARSMNRAPRASFNRAPRVQRHAQPRTNLNRGRAQIERRNVHRNVQRNSQRQRVDRTRVRNQRNVNRNVVRNKTVVQQKNVHRGRRIHFSESQRRRAQDFYRHHRGHFHRVARVPWPIVVGGYVPRDYTVYDIPDDFYGYVPGYEGYKYIIVGDQLIIIDPDTWEIVAVIPLY